MDATNDSVANKESHLYLPARITVVLGIGREQITAVIFTINVSIDKIDPHNNTTVGAIIKRKIKTAKRALFIRIFLYPEI